MSSGKWLMSSVLWLMPSTEWTMPSTEFSAVHNEMVNVQFIHVVYNKNEQVLSINESNDIIAWVHSTTKWTNYLNMYNVHNQSYVKICSPQSLQNAWILNKENAKTIQWNVSEDNKEWLHLHMF